MKEHQFFVWRKADKDTLLGVFKTYADAVHCFTVESSNRQRALTLRVDLQLNISHRGEESIIPPDIERIDTSGVLTIDQVHLDDGYVMDQRTLNVSDDVANRIAICEEAVKKFEENGNVVPSWQNIPMKW